MRLIFPTLGRTCTLARETQSPWSTNILCHCDNCLDNGVALQIWERHGVLPRVRMAENETNTALNTKPLTSSPFSSFVSFFNTSFCESLWMLWKSRFSFSSSSSCSSSLLVSVLVVVDDDDVQHHHHLLLVLFLRFVPLLLLLLLLPFLIPCIFYFTSLPPSCLNEASKQARSLGLSLVLLLESACSVLGSVPRSSLASSSLNSSFSSPEELFALRQPHLLLVLEVRWPGRSHQWGQRKFQPGLWNGLWLGVIWGLGLNESNRAWITFFPRGVVRKTMNPSKCVFVLVGLVGLKDHGMLNSTCPLFDSRF